MIATPKTISLDKKILKVKDEIRKNNITISDYNNILTKDVNSILKFDGQLDSAEKALAAYQNLLGGGLRSIRVRATIRKITKKKLKLQKDMAKSEKKNFKKLKPKKWLE